MYSLIELDTILHKSSKARNESRFQRWRFRTYGFLGRCSRLD